MSIRLLIWDFDGTLAHRRGETGWGLLLAEPLDAEEPGHGHSADTFRPHLRDGLPWHRPAAEAVGMPAVLVRRPDPRAERYADTLAGVDRFVEQVVAA
jgi:FMN phosphatase YigB (HAD superfamily)